MMLIELPRKVLFPPSEESLYVNVLLVCIFASIVNGFYFYLSYCCKKKLCEVKFQTFREAMILYSNIILT